MRFFIFPVIFFFLFASLSMAQTEANLLFNWDKRRSRTYENIFKLIPASNGRVVAVGEALGANLIDSDGLFLVLEAESGKELLRKSFGGNGDQTFHSVVQNHDGTFTLVGYTKANLKTPGLGWILQLDMEGNLLFEKTLPGKDQADAAIVDVAINLNGEVLACGWQSTQRTDKIWLLELGNTQISEHLIARTDLGKPNGIASGLDGHFVLIGSTAKEHKAHPADAWIIKVDKEGNDLWGGAKFLGDSGWQQGADICGTAEGGYVLAGATSSKGAGMADQWLVKLNAHGDQEWEKTYGGHADDLAAVVLELSEGGYAIFGRTWSNMPRAQHATLELLITDDKGLELDKNTYAIRQVLADGNEQAHTLTELFTGDIVFAGTSVPEKQGVLPSSQVSSVAYKTIADLPRSGTEQKGNLYGNNVAGSIQCAPAIFHDANNNQLLESNERGYLKLTLTNNSRMNLNKVSGKVSGVDLPPGLDFWEEIKIGTIRAGQTEQLIVPVTAKSDLPSGIYALTIAIEVDGVAAATSTAAVESNRPEMAKLMAEGQFTPTESKPGETITLNVRLINIGGRPNQPVEALLSVPDGVNYFGSKTIQIPALEPNQRYDLTFPFSYERTYLEKSIDFRLEAKGPNSAGLVKTFRMDLGKTPVLLNTPADGYMAWVSHEPGKAAVSVNNREVKIKVVAISKIKLEQDKFAVLINGKRVQGQKMDEAELTPPGERNDQYYSNVITLKEGLNQVQILYPGETAISSPVLTFDYSPRDKPNLYVLSIGVPYDNLSYTVKDAGDIANAYLKLKENKGKVFRDIQVYPILKKEDATTFNIRKAFIELESMRRIKDGDLLVVYISSHGKITTDNQFILIPSDYQPNHLEALTSINFEKDVLDRLRNIPGNKLVFIDACHSGKATIGSKDYTDAASSKFLNDLLQATAGLEIFASCSDLEYSYEDERWANSAFTKAIIEAFNNERVEAEGGMIIADIFADNPVTGLKERGSDGVITIGELKEFLRKRVPFMVKTVKNEKQNPHNRSTDLLPENTGIYMVNQTGN